MNNNINKLSDVPKAASQSSDTESPKILQSRSEKIQELIETLSPLEEVQTQVVVLQHPQEKKEDLATVEVLKKCLPNVNVKIGLSWPSLKKILGRDVDHNRWAVLYLGTQADSSKVLDSKSEVILNGKAKSLSQIEGFIVLDGSWREAKTLWWRNAWLLKLNRIVLNPSQPSIYNSLRKEPRKESVSTLEAVGIVLSEIEKEPKIHQELTERLKQLISKFGRAPQKRIDRRRRSGFRRR